MRHFNAAYIFLWITALTFIITLVFALKPDTPPALRRSNVDINTQESTNFP